MTRRLRRRWKKRRGRWRRRLVGVFPRSYKLSFRCELKLRLTNELTRALVDL